MRMTSWAFDLGIVLHGNNPGCDCKLCTSGCEKNLRGLTQSTSDATPRLRAKRGVSCSRVPLPAEGTAHRPWLVGAPSRQCNPPFLFPTPQFLNPDLLSQFSSPFYAQHTHHISRKKKKKHLDSKEELRELVILDLGSFKTEREKERMKYEPSHSPVL